MGQYREVRMRRREFVAGGVALTAGKVAFPTLTLAQPAPASKIERIIDAHCHVFNAADLPIEGFARRIMIPKTAHTSDLVARFAEYPGALEALVHAVTVQVKRGAPNSGEEIEAIDQFERNPHSKPTNEWRRSKDLETLRSAFRLVWFNGDIFGSRDLSLPDGIALEIALEHVQLFLYQQLHEDFGKPELTPEERDVLRNLEPFQIDTIADELYSRDDLLGRYIRWALLYTRYRYELAEVLDQVHGNTATQKSRVVLMTPAIIDFSKWVEDDDHLTIEDQVEVMARIACRKSGPRVHGFVGFDPLRQALYEHGRRRPGDKEPMAMVRRAVEVEPLGSGQAGQTTGGLVGVKLYPPMGFQPIDNGKIPDARFNDPAYLNSPDFGLAPQIGRKLDAALSRLYTWCSASNVPVMAHTSHSYGPSAEYEDRADPAFWAQALKHDAFPHLRVNMAHFGHFHKAVPYKDVANHVDACWEWTVGKIITNSPNAYAYADISSLSEILKTGASKKIVECMRAFKDHFPNSDERLMYGTDWSMIAQEERFPKLLSSKPFPDIMILFLRAVGYDDAQIEAIMFRNATRFLGLGKSEYQKFGDNSTRGRLEKFYRAHGLSSAWMAAFD
jgi:predicted TIM-barrel fold metal-dependent hydrolase